MIMMMRSPKLVGCYEANLLRQQQLALKSLLFCRTLATKSSIPPPKNHYQVLGLTSKATQSEIKASYYKLSKMFHPDVNTDKDDEALNKFRQVTAAYEVLGNLKLRKMYDKGLLPRDGVTFRQSPDSESDDTFEEQKKSSPFKQKRYQPTTGRTDSFNFDEWSRMHYGYAMNRKSAAKERAQNAEDARIHYAHTAQNETIVGLAFVVCVLFVVLNAIANESKDKPIINNVKKDES